MALPAINPTHTKAWKALQDYFVDFKDQSFSSLTDPKHFVEWKDFYFDFSKNRIDEKVLKLLVQLAEEVQLEEAIEKQFSGEKINKTEDRAVLHTALRDFDAMLPEIKNTLDKMRSFSAQVISGEHLGYTGKPITDIVNIGIGGSHLGPEMVYEALRHYRNHIKLHFVANIDGDKLGDTLEHLDPETTLFIVVSKSFTTQETLTNAAQVRKWFLAKAMEKDIEKHFIAVSANPEEALTFGISEENIFPMNDWVGGRFSMWSAVGLSICCAIGYAHFYDLLYGAYESDQHFKETSFEGNIPVLMALLSVWYNNFFDIETEVIVGYSEYLQKLVPYLQQAVMESNGKGIDRNQNRISYQTGTVVWGDVGSNAQHAFFQLLHQGTKWAPIDFIGFSIPLHKNFKENHNILMANMFAQSEALWFGSQADLDRPIHKSFIGNRPSNTFLIKQLTPKNLGRLIALYEHKIFVQGIVWNIYSYDQWGVELGKEVAKRTLKGIEEKDPSHLENPVVVSLLKKHLNFISENQ